MTFRETEYLTITKEFTKLVNDYELKFKLNERTVFIYSKCMFIEIYGYCNEDLFYFDFYSHDFSLNSNISRLLSNIDIENINPIIESQKNSHNSLLIKTLQGNSINTLKAEQSFMINLKFLDTFLGNYLSCNKPLDLKTFTPTFEVKKNELIAIFQ